MGSATDKCMARRMGCCVHTSTFQGPVRSFDVDFRSQLQRCLVHLLTLLGKTQTSTENEHISRQFSMAASTQKGKGSVSETQGTPRPVSSEPAADVSHEHSICGHDHGVLTPFVPPSLLRPCPRWLAMGEGLGLTAAQGPATAAGGARAKGRLLEDPHCLKHQLTWAQRRAWAVPQLTQQSPGKGWLAAASRLSPLLIPRSASSGLLPSQAFFSKMQGYLLQTAYLHLQMSHLLQQKLQLLGLLCQRGVQIPAGTGKQMLSESSPFPWERLSSARSRDTGAFCFVNASLPPQAERKAMARGKYGNRGC